MAPPDRRCFCGGNHDPVPASESSARQRAPRHSTNHHRRKKNKTAQLPACVWRLSALFTVADNSSGVSKSLWKTESARVCARVSFGFQFGTPSVAHSLTHTNNARTHARTHWSPLATLPRWLLPPSNSQQAPRQTGPADCSRQQRGSRQGRAGGGICVHT